MLNVLYMIISQKIITKRTIRMAINAELFEVVVGSTHWVQAPDDDQ